MLLLVLLTALVIFTVSLPTPHWKGNTLNYQDDDLGLEVLNPNQVPNPVPMKDKLLAGEEVYIDVAQVGGIEATFKAILRRCEGKDAHGPRAEIVVFQVNPNGPDEEMGEPDCASWSYWEAILMKTGGKIAFFKVVLDTVYSVVIEAHLVP